MITKKIFAKDGKKQRYSESQNVAKICEVISLNVGKYNMAVCGCGWVFGCVIVGVCE